MSELCVPLDYEQLPELWRLRNALRRSTPDSAPPITPKQIDAVANFLFCRLLVTLGYLARSTNRPGVLTDMGAQQLRASLDPLFGDDCDPVAWLADCGLLVKSDTAGEFICPVFAKLNLHLSGDYKPGHMKGNVNSRLSAAMKNIVGESAQQLRLLPEDVFKKNDGSTMTDPERMAALRLVRTLDRCLMKPTRNKLEFTAGVMASAHALAGRVEEERLRQFYFWLANHCERPEVAKTAEEVIQDFDRLLALAQAEAVPL